jgi:hypothetical protein
VHELESNRHQYDIDLEKVATRKKYQEKLNNLQCALSSILEDTGNFRMKQMRTIEKELSNLSSLGPSSFDALFDIKVQFIQKIHGALVRRDKRNALVPSVDISSTKSTILFVKQLYNHPKEDPKVIEQVLRRVNEIPKLQSIVYIPDHIPKIPEEVETICCNFNVF